MAIKQVAFAGVECFDLILYQARILSKLGKRVLVIENMNNGAIRDIVPRPLKLGEQLNPITYRNVDFAIRELPTESMVNYDFVFYSCDFRLPDEAYDKIIFITDLFLHHINMIHTMFLECQCIHKSILVRNVIDTDINIKATLLRLGENVEINYINFDEFDYSNSIRCQHYQTLSFQWLSGRTKKYLIKEVNTLCPEVGKRGIHRAYKAAKGGR